ncbi:rhomboid family intramembrane serine protease [Candidatus Acetothermia bacterium]|nr:rhomboid family intramembrane serine protease [Candidatus Acetothermia bacterium]MBI3461354.1 rhomboid family intramembrane serine protease [Candidatus Acetothermia bacterium]
MFGFGWPTEAVLFLMLLNLVAYFAQKFTGDYGGFTQTYWLEPSQVVHHRKHWQLVTHLFLHDPRDLSHLLFNMVALWMFGPAVQDRMGAFQFMLYYLFTGIGAALLTIAMGYWRDRSLMNVPPSLGASGAIYGLLIAYAVMFPDANMFFLFPPVPINARVAAVVVGLVAIFAEVYRARSLQASRTHLSTVSSRVNHLAHLGGLLFGLIYLTGRLWLGY